MGGANCNSNHKFIEEYKREINICNSHVNELQRIKSIYQTMTARVFSNKEKTLKSVSTYKSHIKNFDSYYAFLSNQIKLYYPSINKQKNTLTLNKENIPFNSCKRSARCPRSNSRLRLFNVTNTFLYAESPLNGIFPKGEKFRQLTSSTTRGVKKSTEVNASIKSDNSNFDIISLLPQNVQVIILNYLINQYRSLLSLSAVWHSMILSSLEWLFNPIENKLIEKIGKCFYFHNSFTQSTMNNNTWRGARVDRIIQLELLEGFEGKTLSISYTYSFINDKKKIYRTQYKIDCISKKNKAYWIHQAGNGVSECTYTMNIIPICTGDVVEIAINYYTARGLIDSSSIVWQPIEIEKTISNGQSVLREEGANKGLASKRQVDLNRICELEAIGSEWYDSKYYKMSKEIDLGELLDCFAVNSTEFSWNDIKTFRIRMTAYRTGYIRKSIVGIPLSIKAYGEECINEVKRLGLMIDRGSEVQLRVGDTLVLYISNNQET